MLRLFPVVMLAGVLGCGDTSSPGDLSSPGVPSIARDLGGGTGGASDGGSGCAWPLAAWCAAPDQTWEHCVPTLAAATRPSSWSAWCGPAATVSQATCGGYTIVAQAGADFSTQYVYDASGGQLVAVVEFGYQGTHACVAGPSTFAFTPCGAGFTPICP